MAEEQSSSSIEDRACIRPARLTLSDGKSVRVSAAEALRLEVANLDSLITLVLERAGQLDPYGTREVRVPYGTDAPNGDGCVLPGAELRVGDRAVELRVPEAAVREGSAIELGFE